MTVANEHTLGPQYGIALRALTWAAECPCVQVSGRVPPAAEISDFMRRRLPPSGVRPKAVDIARRVEQLHRQVTTRDELLLHALAHHRVLTTEQIAAMAFGTVTTARHRLAKLHQLGLIRSFRRRGPGHGLGPAHHQLALLGAGWIAHRCASRTVHGWRADRAASAQSSTHLRHLVGLNDLVAGLAAVAPSRPGSSLLRWWSEVDCDSWCGDIVQPDARLVWAEADQQIEALVEYDRGTEPHHRLLTKMRNYAELERDRGRSCWVLLAFTSPRRERAVRATLLQQQVDVPVATCSIAPASTIHEPLWQPLHDEHAPCRLIDLNLIDLPPAALARAARGGRNWKYQEVTTGKETHSSPLLAD